ncbi:MAG: 2-amino-4-hydroxy-6-hydroxymethyldihydropteridine diphosphokinase [Mariprofundus sp.]|nr:2-amino-4-hydroxy-6-hydroxymethyldihydropteridine diphosphokinase [Mariprofundus sp.]
MNNVFIAFGGNLGDVLSNFRSARQNIARLEGIHVTRSSLLYRTPPLGPAGQPDYLNAMIAAESELKPLALLTALQTIETQHGRIRAEHWGARTMDLDIIAMDSLVIDDERLSIPHPQMHHRQFVLRPLCDIEPNWQHPNLNKTASQLLNALLLAGEAALPQGIAW